MNEPFPRTLFFEPRQSALVRARALCRSSSNWALSKVHTHPSLIYVYIILPSCNSKFPLRVSDTRKSWRQNKNPKRETDSGGSAGLVTVRMTHFATYSKNHDFWPKWKNMKFRSKIERLLFYFQILSWCRHEISSCWSSCWFLLLWLAQCYCCATWLQCVPSF